MGQVSHLIPHIITPHQPRAHHCTVPHCTLTLPQQVLQSYINPTSPHITRYCISLSCFIQIQATHLRIFDVSFNSIGGEIHSGFFAQVLGMTSLLLSGNKITGSLPAGLGYV